MLRTLHYAHYVKGRNFAEFNFAVLGINREIKFREINFIISFRMFVLQYVYTESYWKVFFLHKKLCNILLNHEIKFPQNSQIFLSLNREIKFRENFFP